MATANYVYRDWEMDGVPSSGEHWPIKSEIRVLLTEYEAAIAELEAAVESLDLTAIPALTLRVSSLESQVALLMAGASVATVYRETYTALALIVGTNGQRGEVIRSATGTHTDPVVGGTVNNAGIYTYYTSPAGWKRIGDNESILIKMTTGGTATAITTVSSPVQAAYGEGNQYQFIIGALPTGPATINVDGIGAKRLLWEDGSELEAAAIDVNKLVFARYHLASDSMRIVYPVRKDPSLRLGHKALQSYLAQISIATPASRYNAADVGDGWSVTTVYASTFASGRIFNQLVLPGDTLIAEMTPSGTIVGSNAVMIGVSNHNPVADYEAFQAGTVLYGWRSDGNLVAYDQGASTTLQSYVVPKWASGDVLRMEMIPGADNASGQIVLYNNGEFVGSYAFTQKMSNGYALVGSRSLGASYVVTASLVRLRRGDGTVKTFHINGSAVSSGAGDRGDIPFMNIKDAISDVSGKGRSLILKLKNSLRGSLVLPSGKYDEIRIVGDVGTPPTIYGSALYSTGWTKTVGRNFIWERDGQWAGKIAYSFVNGGIVEVTSGVNHLVGRVGSLQTIPILTYARQTPNTSLATLDGTPATYMTDATANKMYVHARGSVDANTLFLEYADRGFCIGLISGSLADYHATRLIVENIDLRYSYGSCLQADKAKVDLYNVRAYGSAVGSGFNINDCNGIMAGCLSVGNNNDGINHSSFQGATGYSMPPALEILDHYAKGQIVGDGISNHGGATFHVKGGSFIANGKNGIVPADGDATIDGALIQDNVSQGLHVFADNDRDQTVDVRNSYFLSNNQGIQATASIAVPTKIARVNSRNNHFKDNVVSSLAISVSATYAAFAVIDSTDDVTSGATPSSGHKVAGNGTLTTRAGVAI